MVVIVCSSHAQLCPLPEQGDIFRALNATLKESESSLQGLNEPFGSGDTPSAAVRLVDILTYNFTCLAARGAGGYSYASVVILYSIATDDPARLIPCDMETGQIQLVCTSGLESAAFWQETGEGLDESLPEEPFAIPTRSDCWKCQEEGEEVDTISNCLRKQITWIPAHIATYLHDAYMHASGHTVNLKILY